MLKLGIVVSLTMWTVSAFAIEMPTQAAKNLFTHALVNPAFACGNGTKCCWTECHAGTGCIQRCDDGR